MKNKVFFAPVFALAVLLAVPGLASAQGFDYNDIIIKVNLKGDQATQESPGILEFTFTIPFGFSMTLAEDFPGIKLMNEVPGLILGKLEKPEPDHTDAVGGHYEFNTVLKLPFHFSGDSEPGEHDLVFGFLLQVCNNKGQCYAPCTPDKRQETFRIKLNAK